jgi:phage host-nuclease inhibitor protein Gam
MKNKIIHCIVNSREELETMVADTARLKIDFTNLTSAMELEMAAIQKRYQPALQSLAKQIEIKESNVVNYCRRERDTLFASKRSLKMMLATIGFRATPPRVERIDSKARWASIARRLANADWGRDYLHTPAPEINKERLLADRTKLSEVQLGEVGLKFEQGENFFLEPNSKVAKATRMREAA